MRSCGGESGHNGGGVRLVMRSRKEEGRDKVGILTIMDKFGVGAMKDVSFTFISN